MKKVYKQWFRVSPTRIWSFLGSLEAGAKLLGADNLLFVEVKF